MSKNGGEITGLKIMIIGVKDTHPKDEVVICIINCRYIVGKSEKLPDKIEDIINDLGLNYE